MAFPILGWNAGGAGLPGEAWALGLSAAKQMSDANSAPVRVNKPTRVSFSISPTLAPGLRDRARSTLYQPSHAGKHSGRPGGVFERRHTSLYQPSRSPNTLCVSRWNLR